MDLKVLHAKIGELTLENDFFVRRARQGRPAERKKVIDRDNDLTIVRPAKALELSRSTVYYKPRPVSAEDSQLMRRLDELHLDYAFAEARMLRDLLWKRGRRRRPPACGDADEANGDRSALSATEYEQACAGAKIYPYLLRGVTIDRPNHVWAMDISYIPMRRGFVYLDVPSRRVLAHRVSITMEAEFCVEAVKEALAKHGKPEIFNTDQGSRFASLDFTRVLLDAKITISMDGEGAWRDNVFVERLWRSVKYEEVYFKAYDTVSEARASIGRYLAFYNERRPHSSLDGRTPNEAYFSIKETAWPHDRRFRFCRSSGPATPSRCRDKIETPRVQQTPAGIHLKSARSCPNNRSQLSPCA